MLLNKQRLNCRKLLLSCINYHRRSEFTEKISHRHLISDNYVIQKFLWIELFKNYQFQHSEAIIIHSIVAVALVYIICTIIDLARQITFEKQFMYIANKYGDILLRPGKRIINPELFTVVS